MEWLPFRKEGNKKTIELSTLVVSSSEQGKCLT